MEFKTTKVFKDILAAWTAGKRGIMLEGGTSSSKTWSALQALIIIAQEIETPALISVVSETLPHLKRGCIRDFFNIIGESRDSRFWSATEFTYSRPDWKGTFEYFGADNPAKVRGPRRQILYINEGNNVLWDTADGLNSRTSVFTIVDWNPVGEFWAHEKYLERSGDTWIGRDGYEYSHSTYVDAKHVLPQTIVDNIESHRDTDPNWWRVYGLGLLGKIEGLVHPNFYQEDLTLDRETNRPIFDGVTLPLGFTGYGLDFGFADDPAVLTKNVVIGDKLFSKQVLYQRGLTNDELARYMDLAGVDTRSPIYADSAEPKSIAELRGKGYNIIPAEKGQGSVAYGIQKVNQFKQYWTTDSLDCIKEQRNYTYLKDKNGKFTDKTNHEFSHGMDSRRYFVSSMREFAASAPLPSSSARTQTVRR